ncbi:F-box domain-containing protein [Colletotrichum musicola]|uniref:F-box domain-containing protein n=1 Tax=Colletotrichum musicola TaxID=2175873 RepID=A0A8H6K8A6_9PEZI|nr:F-box domain-containing protein [Colletotrichum musicola]
MNNLELLIIETSYANHLFVIPFRKHLRHKRITLPSVNALTYHTSTTVDFLPDVFANLQVLCLTVGKSLKKTRVDGGLRSTRASSLIPAFQKFPNLVDLTLAANQAGYDRGSYSQNREAHLLSQNSEVNAVALFQSCQHLKKLLLDNGFRRETFCPRRQGDEVTDLAVETENYRGIW